MTVRTTTLLFAILLLQCPAARSAPLDKASCDQLKVEQGQLEGAGVRASMSKGPEWAKANLGADKLGQVRRLIELDAQILFRCDGRPLVALPKEVEADPAAIPVEAKAEGHEPGATKPDAAKAEPTQKKASPPPKKAAVAKEKVDPAAKTPVKDGPAKKAPPVPPKAPAKQAKDNTATPAAGAETAKAKPKPKPKAKADDAYRPPNPDPGNNPFANQLAPQVKN